MFKLALLFLTPLLGLLLALGPKPISARVAEPPAQGAGGCSGPVEELHGHHVQSSGDVSRHAQVRDLR
jgi:hypothetical protein